MNKIIISIIVIIVVVSCAPLVLVTPTQADVDRIKSVYPDYTLTDLNQGKSLYEQKCNTCHGLKDPSKRSAKQWQEIVPDMSKKANKKATTIDLTQQYLIVKYLVTMCSAPAPGK